MCREASLSGGQLASARARVGRDELLQGAPHGLVEAVGDRLDVLVLRLGRAPVEGRAERETTADVLRAEVDADLRAEVRSRHHEEEQRVDAARRRQHVAGRIPLLPPDLGGGPDHLADDLSPLGRQELVEGAPPPDDGAQCAVEPAGVQRRLGALLVGPAVRLVELDAALDGRVVARVEAAHELVRLAVERRRPVAEVVPLGQVEPGVDRLALGLHPEDAQPGLVGQTDGGGDHEHEPIDLLLGQEPALERVDAVLAVVDAHVGVVARAQRTLLRDPRPAQVDDDGLEPEHGGALVGHGDRDLGRVLLVEEAVDATLVATEPLDPRELDEELRGEREGVDGVVALGDGQDVLDDTGHDAPPRAHGCTDGPVGAVVPSEVGIFGSRTLEGVFPA